MKPTFLNQNRPLITGMILKSTPDEVRFKIKNSINDGADALGVQLCRIKREFRTEENYKAMFSAAGQRPIYITSYRGCENEGLSDEECVENLLMGLRSGATLADVMTDLYDIQEETQFSTNEVAVKKQMELIDKIHSMGKEVLMSTHYLQYVPSEEVLKIALEQQRRGADIAKIVTMANNEDEQMEALKTLTVLKKELKIPFLYLVGGTHSKLHRMVGTALGNVTYLAVHEHDDCAVPTQPTIKAAKQVRDALDFEPDII